MHEIGVKMVSRRVECMGAVERHGYQIGDMKRTYHWNIDQQQTPRACGVCSAQRASNLASYGQLPYFEIIQWLVSTSFKKRGLSQEPRIVGDEFVRQGHVEGRFGDFRGQIVCQLVLRC